MGLLVRGRLALACLATALAATTAGALVPVFWENPVCEPPSVFYSAQHQTGAPACCATSPGTCPGGVACPAGGVCPGENIACVPTSPTTRPNVILMIADDQGSCHYGHAGECRSVLTGTPIPVPITPNLDVLAGYGTVFPIAHNTAAWCFPSLASILTGRYQFNMNSRIPAALAFPTVPRLLRSLNDSTTDPVDPYSPVKRIGGYCTLLAGKFNGGVTPHRAGTSSDTGFDGVAATSDRSLGRNPCMPSVGGAPPACGTATTTTYQPFTTGRMTDIFNFIDSLIYRVPGSSPAQYTVQPFFAWYAPRIPHQPLIANNSLAVEQYLFGVPGVYPYGGAMNLRQWCTPDGFCAPLVPAFGETNFGTERTYYANVWWMDDNLRELRRFFAAEGAPHCIGANGRSKFDVTSQGACTGTWSGVAPDPAANTVLIHLADNGWFLPRSKHHFTENGYRTRIIVFDPRALPTVPSWDPQQVVPPPAQTSEAVADAVDLLPTIVGMAVDAPGPLPCPTASSDGSACNGRDLRPSLSTAPGGPAAPENLRHSLCGHLTQRPTRPTRFRYLLTRPGSVGRCAPTAGAACTTDGNCGAGTFCLGGHCTPATPESACATDVDCPAGSVCLGQLCRAAPACTSDDDCTGLVGPGYACIGQTQRWCRNAPNTSCSADADCPTCPTWNGVPVPCKRLCEARELKLYLGGGGSTYEITDLFLDPDEGGLHAIVPGPGGETTLAKSTTEALGYVPLARRLSCCVDDWWNGGPGAPTACTPGDTCPADFTCNE
jgi:sulfatase-like protein